MILEHYGTSTIVMSCLFQAS